MKMKKPIRSDELYHTLKAVCDAVEWLGARLAFNARTFEHAAAHAGRVEHATDAREIANGNREALSAAVQKVSDALEILWTHLDNPGALSRDDERIGAIAFRLLRRLKESPK
jgi:hypothetical protein